MQSFEDAAAAEIEAGLELLVNDQPEGSSTAKFLALAQDDSSKVPPLRSLLAPPPPPLFLFPHLPFLPVLVSPQEDSSLSAVSLDCHSAWVTSHDE